MNPTLLVDVIAQADLVSLMNVGIPHHLEVSMIENDRHTYIGVQMVSIHRFGGENAK